MTSGSATLAWALVLPATHTAALARLRLSEGVEIAAEGDRLWLRGRSCPPELAALLVALPTERRYEWLDGDTLRPLGSRLVTARLPAIAWQTLRLWLPVALPSPVRAALSVPRAALRLVATTQTGAVNARLTRAEPWARWAEEAPQVRLKPLRFAADQSGRVLVLGSPPPSVPGRPLVECEGVLVPAGCAWTPAVSPRVVRHAFGAGPGTLLWWDETGGQLLGQELFVPASRAGARAVAAAGEPTSP